MLGGSGWANPGATSSSQSRPYISTNGPSLLTGVQKEDLSPGDWALIPAYAEHQEVNDTDTEVVWVIVRAPGGMPVVENLESWGKSLKGDVGPGIAVDGAGNLDVDGPGFEEGDAGEVPLAS